MKTGDPEEAQPASNESGKESEDDQDQEDAVQASLDRKMLKIAMKKRKSNYNAIIKKRDRRKLGREGSEADSFLRMNVEDLNTLNRQSMGSMSPEKRQNPEGQVNLLEHGILLHKNGSYNDDKSSAANQEELGLDIVSPGVKNGSTNIPKDSTGGSGEQKGFKGRKDRFGNKISRGRNKKHRVTFKDQIGKGKVAKVYMVESYKKYNVETTNST
jgi:hypothetical protein